MKLSKAWIRGGLVLLGLLVLALVLFLALTRSRPGEAAEAGVTPAKGTAPGAVSEVVQGGGPRSGSANAGAAKATSTPKRPEVIAEVPWGSGPGQLGRHHSGEGNPEAPMSLAATSRGDVMVLDQVNGRIVRYGSDGKVLDSVPTTQQAPQDVTVARDGTLVVLDRLRDKTVAIIDPNTKELRGELPLKGKNIPEPGLITGTFLVDDSVYVEREHGALVRIGNLAGQADPTQPQLPGRPSRNGQFYVAARISNMQEGLLALYFLDRETGAQRMARELHLSYPLLYITLLDTDLAGVVYVAVVGELPSGKASPPTVPGMRLYCVDPTDGRVMGQADLIYSPMPEETFRDLVVLDEGGVIYQARTETGVTLRRADCR